MLMIVHAFNISRSFAWLSEHMVDSSAAQNGIKGKNFEPTSLRYR